MQKIIVHIGKWLWRDSLWHKVVCNAYGAHANGWDAKLGSVVTLESVEVYFTGLFTFSFSIEF